MHRVEYNDHCGRRAQDEVLSDTDTKLGEYVDAEVYSPLLNRSQALVHMYSE